MTTAAPRVLTTRGELAAVRPLLPEPVAVVMTMGALHEGHVALLDAARKRAATVVTTIFVNPLQFGPDEDLERYPRTMEADLETCARARVDLVFAPLAAEIYPAPPVVTVHSGPLGGQLEGAVRPGHFDGVLTVVLKLLHLVEPSVAVFGEKDYQQLVLIRQMVLDLDLDVEVVGVPTVRDRDRLALSSRNRYLTANERAAALALPAALRAGAAAAPRGPAAVLAAASAELGASEVDYLVLRGPELGPAPPTGPARLLGAVRTGGTRLIDNLPLTLGTGS